MDIDFAKNKRHERGRQCKACKAAYAKEWRKGNLTRLAEEKRAWRAANPETLQEIRRRYYQKNKERCTARNREYYEANREAKLAYAREYQLLRNFGVSAKEYDNLLRQQNGVCAICGEPPVRQRLAVDHDHSTGKVRGLLCFPCNTFLGRFEAWGEKAAQYLSAPTMTAIA